MKKRKLLFLAIAAMSVIVNGSMCFAQVAIGAGTHTNGQGGPAVGGILELDGNIGGLLLPQVAITSITALPASFPPETAPSAGVGLLVYNKTAAVDGSTAIPVGIYYWSGSDSGWKLLC